MTIGIILAHSS